MTSYPVVDPWDSLGVWVPYSSIAYDGYVEYHDGAANSHKFYEVSIYWHRVSGNGTDRWIVCTRYGRVGASGIKKVHGECKNQADAAKVADHIINAKVKKGYLPPPTARVRPADPYVNRGDVPFYWRHLMAEYINGLGPIPPLAGVPPLPKGKTKTPRAPRAALNHPYPVGTKVKVSLRPSIPGVPEAPGTQTFFINFLKEGDTGEVVGTMTDADAPNGAYKVVMDDESRFNAQLVSLQGMNADPSRNWFSVPIEFCTPLSTPVVTTPHEKFLAAGAVTVSKIMSGNAVLTLEGIAEYNAAKEKVKTERDKLAEYEAVLEVMADAMRSTFA